MHVALPESESPVKLVLDPEHPLTDDQYFAFCAANSNLRIERTAQGEIVIVPPAGGESDNRSLEVSGQLRDWARKDGRGTAFGSSVEFILPSGAALSPDARGCPAKRSTVSRRKSGGSSCGWFPTLWPR